METAGVIIILLSLLCFLSGLLGLINPAWTNLPNRRASVKIFFVSVVLLFIGTSLVEEGDTASTSSASHVPKNSAVTTPEPRTTCAGLVLTRARERVGDDNVRDVAVSEGGTEIVVTYYKRVGWSPGWLRVGLIYEAMELMEFAYTEPACRQLSSFGLIGYSNATDRFGNESETKASEMWLNRDIADRINWSNMSSDRDRFESLLNDYGKLWMHRSLR